MLIRVTGCTAKDAKELAILAPKQQIQEKQYGKYTPPSGLINGLSPKDQAYLAKRGFDPWLMVMRHDIQSVGPFCAYPKGIFIPIKNYRGDPVSWTIRAREPGDGPRYLTAKDHQKSESEEDRVFGAHRCNNNTVIVVEGPFDMMKVGPGAGCLLGLAYAQKQLQIISRFARRIICFDNSPHAQVKAAQLCADLSVFPGTTEQVTLDAADPGDATKEQIQELREYAGLE
jgi:hypothetical protein